MVFDFPSFLKQCFYPSLASTFGFVFIFHYINVVHQTLKESEINCRDAETGLIETIIAK